MFHTSESKRSHPAVNALLPDQKRNPESEDVLTKVQSEILLYLLEITYLFEEICIKYWKVKYVLHA